MTKRFEGGCGEKFQTFQCKCQRAPGNTQLQKFKTSNQISGLQSVSYFLVEKSIGFQTLHSSNTYYWSLKYKRQKRSEEHVHVSRTRPCIDNAYMVDAQQLAPHTTVHMNYHYMCTLSTHTCICRLLECVADNIIIRK